MAAGRFEARLAEKPNIRRAAAYCVERTFRILARFNEWIGHGW